MKACDWPASAPPDKWSFWQAQAVADRLNMCDEPDDVLELAIWLDRVSSGHSDVRNP